MEGEAQDWMAEDLAKLSEQGVDVQALLNSDVEEIEKGILIDGCVGVPASVTVDQFRLALLEWIVSKGWDFSGDVELYTEKSDD